ncbi:hypothetical protein EVAR_53867_1 [Eumeta japonica]|uniref:Uncharacterized protein n=1 Tax=Eumeta variegata TaxID=151549 RepID=A0A4C1XIH1_EUMVA|nr:hypothetical protein EVAR_53867_1 [Eumeta japonica]
MSSSSAENANGAYLLAKCAVCLPRRTARLRPDGYRATCKLITNYFYSHLLRSIERKPYFRADYYSCLCQDYETFQGRPVHRVSEIAVPGTAGLSAAAALAACAENFRDRCFSTFV